MFGPRRNANYGSNSKIVCVRYKVRTFGPKFTMKKQGTRNTKNET